MTPPATRALGIAFGPSSAMRGKLSTTVVANYRIKKGHDEGIQFLQSTSDVSLPVSHVQGRSSLSFFTQMA